MAQLESIKIEIGSKAPNFDLPATDGNSYSLDSFKDSKGLVVVFTCNHCPFAKAAWPLLTQLTNEFKNKGVSFVGINPNDETQYPEDSFEVMKQKMNEWQINFPYLRDQTQKVAKEYAAVCTPDIYVYDDSRKLYYHGRINDTWPPVKKVDGQWQSNEPSKQTKDELKEAIESLLEDKSPPKTQNPSMGCSIKWKE